MTSISQVAELAKQVPTYHAFIPVENGRDLVMIKRKLETDQYNSIEALEADFDLMIRNCYTFNGTESQISFSARELSDKFKLGIKRIKAGKSFSRPATKPVEANDRITCLAQIRRSRRNAAAPLPRAEARRRNSASEPSAHLYIPHSPLPERHQPQSDIVIILL